MRRRTISCLFVVCTLLVVSLFLPSRTGQRSSTPRYPPPRPYKAKIPKLVVHVPPKLANGTVPTGWRPFRPPDSYLVAPFAVEPTVAQRLPCIDEWVSQGKVCESKYQGKMDVLWTWINGSEPILVDVRDKVAAANMKGPQNRPHAPLFLGSRTTHFRTHGEMRNSMRSVLKSLPSELVQKVWGSFPCSHDRNSDREQYILLTADVAADDTKEVRLGSVPTWLDVGQGSALRLFHHSDVFRIPESSLPAGSDAEQQKEWRDKFVPSFNSLAIESQLANIADLAPTFFCAFFNSCTTFAST